MVRVWAQDQLQRPVRSSTSHENAELAIHDRDQYSYVAELGVTRFAAARERPFSWVIDQSNDFYITSIVYCTSNSDGSGFNTPVPGWMTLKDGTRNYNICERTWLGAFQIDDTYSSGTYAQRAIWPQPYGIGAGGSLLLTVELPVNTTPANYFGQIYIEGFKDYSIGGICG